MSVKKILITGASGFIGRNLFETLSGRQDIELIGTYHTNKFSDDPRLIKANLTNRDEVQNITKGVDVIIQGAATTSGSKDVVTKPYYHVTDNAVMNSLLFQAAHDHNVGQLVFFSCTTMYPADFGKPVKETDFHYDEIPPKYFGVAWMKVFVEKLCEFYSRLGRTRYTVIRHSNIYGPYDKYDLERSHVFGATITKVMLADKDITVWGEGKEERDLLYVSDLVDFVEKIIDTQDYAFGLFNLGLGESISIRDLVKRIIAATGKSLEVKYDISQPSIGNKLVVDFSKAREKFGWTPKISLDEGIQKTLAWYRAHVPYEQFKRA